MMKQDFRSYALVKALALLLTVACGVAAVLGGFYCVSNWNALFRNGGGYSQEWERALNNSYEALLGVLNYYDAARRGESLSYLDEQHYQELLSGLDPAATNFRYIVRDNESGEILLSSAGAGSLDNIDGGNIYRRVRTIVPTAVAYAHREYDAGRDITIFYDEDWAVLGAVAGDTIEFGLLDGEKGTYRYALEYGVETSLPVEDAFRAAREETGQAYAEAPYWTAGLAVAFLAGTVLLLCCAGRRRGAADFTLNWTDKIPYELYLLVVGGGAVVCFMLWFSLFRDSYNFYSGASYDYAIAGGAAVMAGGIALTEAALMSTAARIKTRTLLRNTLTWRLCVWLWRGCKALGRGIGEAAGHLPLTWRVILGALGYLLVNFCLAWGLFQTYDAGFYLILLFLFNGAVLFLVCRWTVQWQKLRAGAQAIVGGEPDAAIDLTGMRWYPDLRGHAEALNDLGGAINAAVEERLKSERMKAELITNVSHDLKTPLTSIINYVDLLKKEDIQSEKAAEYIEVLERKSQRLKKLTEDLVEASKASTGTLAVSPERLGMVQLADQALGEYGEKLEAAGLKLVATLPPEELYVLADGRHVWRILDNLLGNCVKYALPGTRVYLELAKWNGSAILSLKNISASQLNVPPEELMERFVRGDESRTTEGSGLGLSIARSLTELQGGAFRLDIDGDLFKATVALPLCPPAER